MKIFGLLLCFLSASTPLPGQAADSFRLLLRLPVEARFATADKLGNLYVITANNAVVKYASDGRLLARYSQTRLGQAAALDVANPLKVLVWYADFRTLQFLDRSLTPLGGDLNLIEAGYPEVRTVCQAPDGNIWLYDEIGFKLRKISPEGAQLFESQDLSLAFPSRLNLVCIRDNGVQVLVSDPVQGVLAFDAYGQFTKILGISGVGFFDLLDDWLLRLTPDALRVENLQVLLTRQIPLPASARQSGTLCWAAGRRLFVAGGGELAVFSF